MAYQKPVSTKDALDLVEKANETIAEKDKAIEKLTADNTVLKAKAERSVSPGHPAYDPSALYRVGAELLPAEAVHKARDGQWGFDNFGDFAIEVQKSRANGQVSQAIQKAFSHDTVKKAALGMGELVGSDGGFLVPPTFSDKLFERVYTENDLLKRTDQYTVGGNAMVFPRNAESSRATGSRWGGVKAYWVQEGGTITKSAPTFGRLELTLHKLACLAAVTEELIQDSSPAMSQYLNRAFPSEISFLVGDALIRGTGAGQPLGILNAPCKVSVTRDTTGHVVLNDIEAMWARRFKGMARNEGSDGYVWFINQDVNPDLGKLTLGIGAAGVAAYLPPGGLSAAPYMTIKGAPVVEIEWCESLGTSGDIILADMSQMVSISKGGMNAASSIHLYFDTDQQAFRVTFRLDAKPWWATALTPYKGSNTQSPFVVLS